MRFVVFAFFLLLLLVGSVFGFSVSGNCNSNCDVVTDNYEVVLDDGVIENLEWTGMDGTDWANPFGRIWNGSGWVIDN